MSVVFSVISYRGGTGKSLIAFSLASVLARDDKVLFVDADFLAPSLYILLDQKPRWTWNDYLMRRCDLASIITTVKTEKTSLDIIVTKPNDHEILYYFQDTDMWSKFFTDQILYFLNDCRDRYRYIFFDNQSGLFLSTLTHSFFSDYLIVLVFPDQTTVKSTVDYLTVQNKPFFLIWNHVLSDKDIMEKKIDEWSRDFETLSTYRGTLGKLHFDEQAAVNRWIEGRLFLDDHSELMKEITRIASLLREKVG